VTIEPGDASDPGSILSLDTQRDGIRQRLENPAGEMTLSELCRQWFSADITIRVAGASKLVGDLGFPGRVRGAFGAQLMESASREAIAGEPCPWNPPCAFEMLFRKQGRMETGFDYPTPWIILVDASANDLLVTLRLFGFATEFAPAAAEALTAAVQKRLDLAGDTGFFLPKPVIVSRRIRPLAGLESPRGEGGIKMEFLTPVAMSSNSPLERPQSLFSALAQRAAGLARWHDARLELDRDELRHALAALDFDWMEARPAAWLRGSNKQGKAIPMHGYLGALIISGSDADMSFLAPLLAVGEAALIGADVAFGCGRFRICQ
jgi:CRISPR-associated endoribonuclease Cas6